MPPCPHPSLITPRNANARVASVEFLERFAMIARMSELLNPKRTVAELKELRALTGDDNGAQRVAFTPTWVKAREWFQIGRAHV